MKTCYRFRVENIDDLNADPQEKDLMSAEYVNRLIDYYVEKSPFNALVLAYRVVKMERIEMITPIIGCMVGPDHKGEDVATQEPKELVAPDWILN